MIRIVRFFFVVCALLLFSCSANKTFLSYWNAENRTDFFSSKEAITYHPADGISLKLFNNNEYIDIIVETNSEATLRKLYNLGLSIWIDPEGNLKNIVGIHYPLPVEIPFSEKAFASYLEGFSKLEFQEELVDRFQNFEVIDTRSNERLLLNTLNSDDENFRIQLKTSQQILFSYQLRFPLALILDKTLSENPVISIGVTSVNEADEEYYSALSSKEYIRKRMGRLKAGENQNRFELTEWWTNFQLAKGR